jgi:hypothetical protein
MPLLGTPIIVVGYYVGFNNGVGGTYGFREIGGTYTNLSVPVANSQTFAYGINNASQIVGYYRVGTVNHGFLYDGVTYTTLDDPFGTSACHSEAG